MLPFRFYSGSRPRAGLRTVSRPLMILASLLAATLAGCFGAPQDTPESPPVETDEPQGPPPDFVDPLILDHDHSDASLHEFSWRMKELYHHPLGGNQLK